MGLISYPSTPKYIHKIHKLPTIFENLQKEKASKRLPYVKLLN
ncbi:hypothetical protein VHARVF571_180084 [Vibrio harveyi]|nr:hypothetical protein VHARVF571_180084 [Vibrio harveyi]